MQKPLLTTVLILLLNVSKVWPDENVAVAKAVKDILTVNVHDRKYVRYIWLQDGSQDALHSVSLTLNYISRTSTIKRPIFIDHDLVKFDCRYYGIDATWNELRFDPKFSLLLTKDTLAFIGIKTRKQVLVDSPPFQEDGKTYTKKWAWVEEEVKQVTEDVVQAVSPHLDQKAFGILVNETGSPAPIVSDRYFTVRALSTIQDKGAYKIIYGGLYYQFANIQTGLKKGTDEDNLFEQLGVGDVESGITAKRIFDRLRSDQRVAIFRSNITGRPRRIDFLRTLAGLDTQSFVSVTHDIKAEDIDIGKHPVMNLLDFKDAAREIIFEKANGLHGFALYDGNGKRTDEAPPDIAIDHLVPAPHSTRLQPAIGCIRCHGKEGGWRVVNNDAKKLLGGLLDIFPSRKADEIDRLVGLYSGNVENKLLPRGRDDYASAILKSTGPWGKDQTEIVSTSSSYLSNLWKEYWYDTIDASAALIELGIKHDKKEAVTILRKLLPPVPVIIDGRIPEDPRIGALLVGLSINRSDFDLVYSFIAKRVKK